MTHPDLLAAKNPLVHLWQFKVTVVNAYPYFVVDEQRSQYFIAGYASPNEAHKKHFFPDFNAGTTELTSFTSYPLGLTHSSTKILNYK